MVGLESEKEALDERVKLQDEHLSMEGSRRKVLEEDVAWILEKGVVYVVDRVAESPEFSLR